MYGKIKVDTSNANSLLRNELRVIFNFPCIHFFGYFFIWSVFRCVYNKRVVKNNC